MSSITILHFHQGAAIHARDARSPGAARPRPAATYDAAAGGGSAPCQRFVVLSSYTPRTDSDPQFLKSFDPDDRSIRFFILSCRAPASRRAGTASNRPEPVEMWARRAVLVNHIDWRMGRPVAGRRWQDGAEGPVKEAKPHQPPGGSGTGSRLLHYFSTTRVDSRGLRGTPVDSTAADKRLTSNVLDDKLRVVSELPKHARTGSTPCASTTATECFPLCQHRPR